MQADQPHMRAVVHVTNYLGNAGWVKIPLLPRVIPQSSWLHCAPRGCKARNCSRTAMQQPRRSARAVRLVCTSHHHGPLLGRDSISLALLHAEEGRADNWQWVLVLLTRQLL